MPDHAKMTLEALRKLARKLLGPGYSRKSKRELISLLQRGMASTRKGGPVAGPPSPPGAGLGSGLAPGLPSPRGAGLGRGRAPAAGSRTPVPGAAAEAKGGSAGGRKATAPERAARAAQKAGQGTRRAGQAALAGTKAIAGAGKAGAATGAIPGAAAARKAAKVRRAPEEGPDPDGYFVARVRGEDAVRDAPHPMTEAGDDRWSGFEPAPPIDDEKLGDLPWGYGDDAFVAMPRDPRTIFLYWDLSQATVGRGFDGLDHPRVQLWIFARGAADFERVRIIEFALESRGFYVHDLEPGRVYRAEIHAVDRAGRERRLGSPTNEVALPPVGPSPIVDDRFVRIPWDLPLGRSLGPGHAAAPFSEESRALLARLSDWSRFSSPTWGGSAGGMGGRPFSPTSSPSSRSSPFGGGR